MSLRKNSGCWVEVTLPLPLSNSFTYWFPKEWVREEIIGYRVVVPFGQRLLVGIITGRGEAPRSMKAKELLALPDKEPFLPPQYLSFLKWMASYYICPLGSIFRNVLVALKGLSEVSICWVGANKNFESKEGEGDLWEALQERGKMSDVEVGQYLSFEEKVAWMKRLLKAGVITLSTPLYPEGWSLALVNRYLKDDLEVVDEVSEVMRTASRKKFIAAYLKLVHATQQRWLPEGNLLAEGISTQLLGRLHKEGLLIRRREPLSASFYKKEFEMPFLTQEEETFLERMETTYWQGKKVAYWKGGEESSYQSLAKIFGVDAIRRGEHLLLLVPNLALLRIWEERLRRVVGSRLSVFSSEEEGSKKKGLWYGLKGMDGAVILGTPSILLSPFCRLDRIIVIEEGSRDYKQASMPRYHGRDAAIMCGVYYGAKVLLIGRVPSLETYYHVQRGKYGRFEMPSFAGAKIATPALHIVTHSREFGFFTKEIIKVVRKAFIEKKKIVFLHPRRGYGIYTSCMQCGWQALCQGCQKPLVYHLEEDKLRCDKCKISCEPPKECASCGGNQLCYRRVGIQQIEENLKLLFPTLRIGRVDGDQTPYAKGYRDILGAFMGGELDCLVGTQRLVRGLTEIPLDMIVMTDPYYWFSQLDFGGKIEVRRFIEALLRHPTAKDIFISMHDRHRRFFSSLRREPSIFYPELLEDARTYDYPPYVRLLKIALRHKKESVAMEGAEVLGGIFNDKLGLKTLGPLSLGASFKGYAEVSLWVKLKDQKIKKTLFFSVNRLKSLPAYKALKISFDVDPIF